MQERTVVAQRSERCGTHEADLDRFALISQCHTALEPETQTAVLPSYFIGKESEVQRSSGACAKSPVGLDAEPAHGPALAFTLQLLLQEGWGNVWVYESWKNGLKAAECGGSIVFLIKLFNVLSWEIFYKGKLEYLKIRKRQSENITAMSQVLQICGSLLELQQHGKIKSLK